MKFPLHSTEYTQVENKRLRVRSILVDFAVHLRVTVCPCSTHLGGVRAPFATMEQFGEVRSPGEQNAARRSLLEKSRFVEAISPLRDGTRRERRKTILRRHPLLFRLSLVTGESHEHTEYGAPHPKSNKTQKKSAWLMLFNNPIRIMFTDVH